MSGYGCVRLPNFLFMIIAGKRNCIRILIFPDTGVSIEATLEDADTAQRIHIILHNMQDPYKEVFTLRVFGELSFKQIASLFGKTENWAAVTFHRAKQKIMHAIQNN